MQTIIFDHNCAGWCANRDYNVLFLERQRCYFTEKLLHRGYVYLNEVYEALGAKWDPKEENICWYGRPIFIDIQQPFEHNDNTFMVKIY